LGITLQEIGKYWAEDLAFVIPTYNRPEKIKDVLDSLARQSVRCGRVIVIDGGQSVEGIVTRFRGRLPVEYLTCQPSGQIRQRNKGLAFLENRSRLIGFLDDDIVLEPGAIKEMLNFWNSHESETAGVSFNIVNNPPFRNSRIKTALGIGAPRQGRILRTGYNVAISPVSENIRTQWLCGGATIWRADVVREFPHREINSRWAICEDALFSYPIGKKYPLYVCAAARVRHEHVYDHKVKQKYRYYGKTVTLWRLYFVESNPDLSKAACFRMIAGQIAVRFLMGVFLLRLREIQYAAGQAEGALIGLSAAARGASLLTKIDEEPSSTCEVPK
jgi:glycosyltransferase involved in cell wall biosynthesis